MGLVSIILWSTLGIALGVGITVSFAGSDTLRDILLRKIFRSNKDGWALVQKGKSYTLERLERDEDAGCWTYDGGEQWVEDPADLMHSIHGVPLGLALDEYRPMVDVEAASAAEASAQKVPDGGELSPTAVETQDGKMVELGITQQDMRDHFLIGSIKQGQRTINYVNPFVRHEDSKIQDLRSIVKLFRHDSGSDTPRKAAKNAKEAERAFEGMGDIKEFGKIVTAFMLGAIATYIGSSGGGGGGGGGGGINVPVMIDAAVMLL